jgi:hypothetical protein
MQNIKNILLQLKNREGMYIHAGYISLLDFIEGYLFCYKDLKNINVSNNFQMWLHSKLNVKFSLRWGYYFLQILAKNDEKKAKEILFDYWDEYLESVLPSSK